MGAVPLFFGRSLWCSDTAETASKKSVRPPVSKGNDAVLADLSKLSAGVRSEGTAAERAATNAQWEAEMQESEDRVKARIAKAAAARGAAGAAEDPGTYK